MKSSFEISNIIFNPLKIWVEKSNGNWNILIGIGLLLVFSGGIMTYVYDRKLGKPDERTIKTSYKSILIILFVVILGDIIFPKEYMWQIFFLLKYGIAFLASGIYLVIQYRKDFK